VGPILPARDVVCDLIPSDRESFSARLFTRNTSATTVIAHRSRGFGHQTTNGPDSFSAILVSATVGSSADVRYFVESLETASAICLFHQCRASSESLYLEIEIIDLPVTQAVMKVIRQTRVGRFWEIAGRIRGANRDPHDAR